MRSAGSPHRHRPATGTRLWPPMSDSGVLVPFRNDGRHLSRKASSQEVARRVVRKVARRVASRFLLTTCTQRALHEGDGASMARRVWVEALYALGSLRAESQLAVFRHAFADGDKEVRKAAISGLE